jgi:hypothetical protein
MIDSNFSKNTLIDARQRDLVTRSVLFVRI